MEYKKLTQALEDHVNCNLGSYAIQRDCHDRKGTNRYIYELCRFVEIHSQNWNSWKIDIGS